MKSLLFIHGPNGVGKTTVCARLHRRLAQSSWLDSEWCRMINPFDLTPEVEALTERHMSVLLRGYLECSLVQYVVFNYGLHGPRKRIFENVMSSLSDLRFDFVPIILTCSEAENVRRMRQDGRDEERIQRGLGIRALYEELEGRRIDTTDLTVEQTVEAILAMVWG